MQIVIDIPDKKYEALKMLESATIGLHFGVVEKAIINGTPLPKGHGRLIDADALKKKAVMCPTVGDAEVPLLDIMDVDCSPTIIEADKEESEEQE